MPSTPKLVAIDIDDVIANVLDLVREWANEQTGASLTREQYHTKDDYWRYFDTIWERHGLHHQLNFRMVLDSWTNEQAHIPVVAGAQKTIQALKKRYTLAFITSRPTYQRDATRRWLDTFIDPDIPLYIAHNPYSNLEERSKGEICAEIGASYLIDDNIGNCQSAYQYGVEPLLFGWYGWNEDAPEHLQRFISWKDIGEYLLRESE